jgi:cerevisin
LARWSVSHSLPLPHTLVPTHNATDVFAPGVNITSLWLNNGYETISGTSMASPHVAGLGAYLLGLGKTKVEDMCETIREMAIKDVVEDLPEDTENLLAYNGVGGAG